jgi:hypothetical protein
MRGKYHNSKKAHKTRNARKQKKTHINLHGGALTPIGRVLSASSIFAKHLTNPKLIPALDAVGTAFYAGFTKNLGKNFSLLKPQTYKDVFLNLNPAQIQETFEFIGAKAGSTFFMTLLAYITNTAVQQEERMKADIDTKIKTFKKIFNDQEINLINEIKSLKLIDPELIDPEKLTSHALHAFNSFHPNSNLTSPLIEEIQNSRNLNPESAVDPNPN